MRRTRLKRVYLEILLVLVGHFCYTSFYKISDLTIRSDGKGYYDYLPAATIYHDLNFSFRSKPMEMAEANINHNVDCNGKVINKYPCGLALLWTPFFVAAHEWAKHISDAPHNGYSLPYHVAIYIAALMFLFIGLVFLRKLLLLYTDRIWLVRWVQLVFLAGTNLYLFAYFEPAFGHVYSFSLITVFLYGFCRWQHTARKKYLYAIAVVLALIVLVRPFNVLVVLFLPFLAGGFRPFVQLVVKGWQTQRKDYLLAKLLFLLVISIQPITWYLQCGHLLPWTYARETFHFMEPALWQTLFGFKKGLFIYTPVLLVSLFAFPVLFRQKRSALALSLLVALFLLYYIIASWQTWWYGGGFGLRPYIDFYSIFAIMFVLVLAGSKKVGLWLAGIFSFLAIALNLLQSWQYTHGIFSGEGMNYENYAAIFLQTNEDKYACWPDYENISRERYSYPVVDSTTVMEQQQKFEKGEWKSLGSPACTLEPGKSTLYALALDIDIREADNPVVYVQFADTAGIVFHYEQRPLFHLSKGKIGRQRVRYFFEAPATQQGKAIFTGGFVKLENAITVYAATLQRLEMGHGSQQ